MNHRKKHKTFQYQIKELKTKHRIVLRYVEHNPDTNKERIEVEKN